jgi:hypothetical protein
LKELVEEVDVQLANKLNLAELVEFFVNQAKLQHAHLVLKLFEDSFDVLEDRRTRTFIHEFRNKLFVDERLAFTQE